MNQYFIPGVLLAGTLFFGYLYMVGPTPTQRSYDQLRNGSEGTMSYSRLQNLKQQTEVHLDLKRQQAQMEQSKNHGPLDPNHPLKKKTHFTSLNRDIGDAERDLDSQARLGAVNLDQRMDEFLAKRQEFEELEQAKKELYVELFIKEARSIGYDVRIDDNFEIKSVRKISSTGEQN